MDTRGHPFFISGDRPVVLWSRRTNSPSGTPLGDGAALGRRRVGMAPQSITVAILRWRRIRALDFGALDRRTVHPFAGIVARTNQPWDGGVAPRTLACRSGGFSRRRRTPRTSALVMATHLPLSHSHARKLDPPARLARRFHRGPIGRELKSILSPTGLGRVVDGSEPESLRNRATTIVAAEPNLLAVHRIIAGVRTVCESQSFSGLHMSLLGRCSGAAGKTRGLDGGIGQIPLGNATTDLGRFAFSLVRIP